MKKFRFKIVVIGNGSVGKTSLIQKFTQGTFQKDYLKTIGAQLSDYQVKIEGDKIKILLWDIAGQDDFHFLRPSFYRASNAAVIVYSLEKNELGERSFEHIRNWYQDAKKFCGDIPILLLANKLDLINENSLNKSIIQEVVDEFKFVGYFLTSAKTGHGVSEAFNSLINHLYHNQKATS